jgi:predicted TPR repeat methyltransferase
LVARNAPQSTELRNADSTSAPKDRSFAEIAVRLFILGTKNTRTPTFDFSSQTLKDRLASEFESSIARGAQFCAQIQLSELILMTARKIDKRPWTEEELQKIRMGCRKGLSARQIADLINRRVASVKKKARELGLVPLKKSAW